MPLRWSQIKSRAARVLYCSNFTGNIAEYSHEN
jgi:hypothetical protein